MKHKVHIRLFDWITLAPKSSSPYLRLLTARPSLLVPRCLLLPPSEPPSLHAAWHRPAAARVLTPSVRSSQKRAGGGDEGDGDWPADGAGAGGRAGDVPERLHRQRGEVAQCHSSLKEQAKNPQDEQCKAKTVRHQPLRVQNEHPETPDNLRTQGRADQAAHSKTDDDHRVEKAGGGR